MTQEATVAWAPANASRRPCTTWTTCLFGRSVSAYVFLDDSLLGAHSRRQLLANVAFSSAFRFRQTPKPGCPPHPNTGQVETFPSKATDGPLASRANPGKALTISGVEP